MAIKIINPIISEAVGGGGASFNIHYGLNPPEDTSMLWVETDKEVASVECGVESKLVGGTVDTLLYLGNPSLSLCAFASVGTNIYIFGGYNSSGGARNTIRLYDTVHNTVSTMPQTLPYVMQGAAACAIGTKIYILGGKAGALNTDTAYTEILCFNTETNDFEETDVSLPDGVGVIEVGCSAVGNRIYMFGGENASGSKVKTIVVYDVDNATCEVLSVQLPAIRCGLTVVRYGTKIYIFGGNNGSTHYNPIFEFDPISQALTQLTATLPEASSYHGVGVVGSVIYLISGSTKTSSVRYITKFDPATEKVEKLSNTLTKYGFCHAEVFDSKIFFTAGSSFYMESFTLEATNLPESNLFIKVGTANNLFALINGDNKVTVGASEVFLGNADNKAEFAKAYLHNGTTWEGI
jgi:hypothetical protein